MHGFYLQVKDMVVFHVQLHKYKIHFKLIEQ